MPQLAVGNSPATPTKFSASGYGACYMIILDATENAVYWEALCGAIVLSNIKCSRPRPSWL